MILCSRVSICISFEAKINVLFACTQFFLSFFNHASGVLLILDSAYCHLDFAMFSCQSSSSLKQHMCQLYGRCTCFTKTLLQLKSQRTLFLLKAKVWMRIRYSFVHVSSWNEEIFKMTNYACWHNLRTLCQSKDDCIHSCCHICNIAVVS